MVDIYKQINAETGGTGGGSSTPFTQSFNATTSWGTASGGVYSITVPQSTHGKDTSPIVQTYEAVLGDFEEVETEIIINALGDVTIQVTETIDARFAGKIVIL